MSTKLGPTSISLGEIEQWCLESSQSIPESADTPFVASHQIIYDDENENGDIDDGDINENNTTNLDRHFHLFGMAVCYNEATQNFRFIFRALQEGLQKLNLEEINPEFLITDGADAIRNTFQDVFGEKPMVMCWAHMRRKVHKNERLFMKASNVFVKKWSKTEPNFVECFQNEWLTTHDAWHEGVDHCTPSTDNALEATNNVIKKENTLRERLPLS
ncbi:unnamed protein product [Rotaria sp. Silwood1]|nr:unnamed protein product [Rotaria sp. Silwood1]CAF3844311.1 unnamed protein product [Rotaria sp. Silwood1]CAF4996315.1 unnamed protein product [Rotaria sp. Silwood1]CAF5111958.1 unnamed protein product [Rotaria sp. Silwood1]